MLRKRQFPSNLSLKRVCELLRISRSTVYYKPKGESSENIMLMEYIEEIYNQDPTIGYRRMKICLERKINFKVNKKRVRRLMRKMGLSGIVPSPKTTETAKTDYKNLLKDLKVTCPNQVWCSDISYIKVKGGFAYGALIVDLYSRKILSLEISNTLDEQLCLEAARKAIAKYGVPHVIHTDRGKQFVGRKFTGLFRSMGTRISVGKRGFKDNLIVERVWRSYKWECVYLRDRMELKELKKVTEEWVTYYNEERPHQSLGYRTPDEVYYGERRVLAG